MTDNEIIKALECCGSNGWGEEDKRPCDKCPMQECEDCEVELPDYALNLINRQKEEIERLTKHLDMSRKELSRRRERNIQNSKLTLNLLSELKIAKSEAIREFAEKLKNLICPQLGISTYEKGEAFHFCLDEIDNLVKEMTGGSND